MLKFLANIKSNLDSVGKTLGSEFSSKPLQKTICYHLIKLSKPSIECHNSNLEHMINRNVCKETENKVLDNHDQEGKIYQEGKLIH